MKKIMYWIFALIIVVGMILTLTIGLKADIVYSKNVEIDVYVGKKVEIKDIKKIAQEIFPKEKMMVQTIELFDDMFSITISGKSDTELKEPINQLKTKIDERYETKIDANKDITITHNPKIRLSSIVKPYIVPIIIGGIIALVYVGIRYKKLGALKTIGIYILHIIVVEAIYLSLLAITRIPVCRLTVPVGLVIYMTVLIALGFVNENKLSAMTQSEKTKK